MVTLILTFKGQPVAKGRPVFSMHAGYPVAYTPAKTRAAEHDIKLQAVSQLPTGFKPLSGPISITIDFFMKRPKSLRKDVKHHIKKPDLENMAKTILDALNRIAYMDDSQVISMTCTKSYATPGTVVMIEEVK
jgi:Holliday junction resolvase RusA-like endonuclease